MNLSAEKIKLIEDIKTILNLNPISNPATQTTIEELLTVITLLQDNELSAFKQFSKDNRKFENGESGYERLVTVSEKYNAEKEKFEKKLLLEKSESKLNFLIKSVTAIKPKMKELIDIADSKIYASRTINQASNLFEADYNYDHLIGTIKNYVSDINKIYTADMAKRTLVEMYYFRVFKRVPFRSNKQSLVSQSSIRTQVVSISYLAPSLLESYIKSYCSTHATSNINLAKKRRALVLDKKENELKAKEYMRLASEFNHSKNFMINKIIPNVPMMRDLLNHDYNKELNFKFFEKVSILGKNPFNLKAIDTLNKLGFKEVFKMDESELKEKLSKSILNHNGFGKQISNSDRVTALIEKTKVVA